MGRARKMIRWGMAQMTTRSGAARDRRSQPSTSAPTSDFPMPYSASPAIIRMMPEKSAPALPALQ